MNSQVIKNNCNGSKNVPYKLKKSTLNNIDDIQKRVSSLTNELERDIEKELLILGNCSLCSAAIRDQKDACQALGNMYHAHCFTCNSCGRLLKNKAFYMVKDKIYCEEDYLYFGFQQAAEKCASCNHLIMDTILQAIGKSFHPGCFRCIVCNKSLDGVPFTIDHSEKVYCIKDYHMMFSIACEKCKLEITPDKENGEIIRINAHGKNFHIDCYFCEHCGHQLTNESPFQSVLFANHLLCYKCHQNSPK